MLATGLFLVWLEKACLATLGLGKQVESVFLEIPSANFCTFGRCCMLAFEHLV